jgi:hypothetical protein
MDFHRFSEASWSQVGIKNRPKIDAKKHPKNDGKQEASWRRLGGILEVQEVSGGGGGLQRAADFRSLNEKFEREEGRYRR